MDMILFTHNLIISSCSQKVYQNIDRRKDSKCSDQADDKAFCVDHSYDFQQSGDHWKSKCGMDACGYQRKEEDHQNLGMDAFADLFPGKSDFLHDLEPSGVLQSF